MKSKTFIDSNIFIYTLDISDKKKRDKAKTYLRDLSEKSRIIVSTQVLNEVYAVSTRKLKVEPLAAKKFVRYLTEFDVIIVTQEMIESAMDCSIINQINYWDALMIAAAESAKCDTLLTEDMDSGQIIRGVEIVNPFLRKF